MSKDQGFDFTSLIEMLESKVIATPNKVAYIFLDKGEVESKKLTYGELGETAKAWGASFQSNVKESTRAILLIPEEEIFVPAFWACIYGGIISIPSPAFHIAFLQRLLPRIRIVLEDANTRNIITTRAVHEASKGFLGSASDLNWIIVDDLSETEKNWQPPKVTSDSPVYIQYTSGSTSAPKGVVISHGNLLDNYRIFKRNKNFSDERITNSNSVNWLPLFHDMGLILGMLRPVATGETMVSMRPIDFIQKPIRWLQAISKYKALFSGGPNFAYDLCVRKVKDEEVDQLDLSKWEGAIVSAEPIRWETIERFAKKFERAGFNKNAFCPCYGLAEATLRVSGAFPGELKVKYLKADLLREKKVVFTSEGSGATPIVSCGRWDGLVVKIVDPENLGELKDGEIGEIWVSSGSVAIGYFNKERETNETFRATLPGNRCNFLRTGDLGFTFEGELYITGRIKDLIIIRGKNHYPQDIEHTVEKSHDAIRPGCVAAFSVDLESEEKLVITAEAKGSDNANRLREIAQAAKTAVVTEHDVVPHDICLVPPGFSFKTSSGKIQRHLTREMWIKGKIEKLGSRSGALKRKFKKILYMTFYLFHEKKHFLKSKFKKN